MDRRDFSRILSGVVLGSAVLPALPSLAAPTAAQVPFRFSVMLWTIYRKLPFDQRVEKVAEAGYHAVELVDEYEKWSPEDFRRASAKLRSLGIVVDAMAGVWTGIANPQAREKFLTDLTKLVPVAEQLECPAIIVLSGDRVEGLSREAHHQSCIESLKRAAEIADRRNLTLLLENIDQEENPKYYLTSVAEGFEIIREVNHPRVKFLYDFYHEQISEGNLIEKLEKNIAQMGLVHVADVPGRHEPGTGEINYANIYRKLAQLNYRGYAAMEFEPTGDPVASLRTAREQAMRAAQGK
ncbi:MAG: TIM barrel protein [Acidobacteriales bacterium]|nr:TIM barrel protein [Candidatus Koribacter versatilis]MBI3645825.1 TIM barrel protein [Terriglobales bacterium]